MKDWPYENEIGVTQTVVSDVLVLGGGLAGCYAAIAAARKGKSVVLVEKGGVHRSGSAGTGFDHWESICTNPGSRVTPKEIAEAYIEEQDEYSNGIAHYIECREGYDRLLDMESFGGKVRDTEDEFQGAAFRDDRTKLMYAYDYRNRFTMRVWGSTFKPALAKELKRLGVHVFEYTEATDLLTAGSGKEKHGVGAVGMNVHTGRILVFLADATILAMSRPARIWLFHPDLVGLSEFRPPQSIGSGHAMGWRAGVEFTLMEKSVRAEYSAAGRSFPAYGTGNNHNTWYAATMVDARGREIPYVDRDGRELKTVAERYLPAPGQKFFLKGGVIDEAKYEYRGPETLPFDELMRRGYELPFYADLSRMPDEERRVIWGMMVGEEGKTKIPILQDYRRRGFDPVKHMLRSYGTGWKSASFTGQERQLFGAPGGILEDWDLMTNIPGIFAAGDQLYASDCAGYACATGYYAGRKAAGYASRAGKSEQDASKDAGCLSFFCEQRNLSEDELDGQIQSEKERLYHPLDVPEADRLDWRELNMAIAKVMQNYCGEIRDEAELKEALRILQGFEKEQLPRIRCQNPHELMRTHEVSDILTVAQMIVQASLFRQSSSEPLCFTRSDYPEKDPENDRKFITIRQENGVAVRGEKPLNYYGSVQEEYNRRNADYIAERDAQYGEADHESGMLLSGTYMQEQGIGKAAAETETIREKPAECEAQAPDLLSSTQYSCGEASRREFRYQPAGCSAQPIHINPDVCIGCGRCVRACQADVLLPGPEKGAPPVVAWPGDCWYCGACVMECPRRAGDAIRLVHPLMNRAEFVPVIREGQEPNETEESEKTAE